MPEIPSKIVFSATLGYDGSGQHSVYGYRGNESSNMLLGTFTSQNIKDPDGYELWSCVDVGGHNSPQNTRPLALFPEKETREVVTHYNNILEAEMNELRASGVRFEIEGKGQIECEVKLKMTALDGKLITMLLGCHGAYCPCCTKSSVQCHSKDQILEGFTIDRSVPTMVQIARDLSDEEGNIQSRPGDYSGRGGQTAMPITREDLTHILPVLHSKIQTFNWFINLLVRANTHRKWGDMHHPVRYTKEETDAAEAERERIKFLLDRDAGIKIGKAKDPGKFTY